MSQIKHYIAYDGGNDVTVDAQTLREIYLAPFVDTADVGVSSMMCSYNKINGLYACGNGEVNRLFREEGGFKGFNTSDWGGTHGTLYINEGLDLEMPSGTFFGAVPAPPRAAGPAPTREAPPRLPEPRALRAARRRQIPVVWRLRIRERMLGGPGMAAAMPEERGEGGGQRAGGGQRRGGDPAPIGMIEAVKTGQVKEVDDCPRRRPHPGPDGPLRPARRQAEAHHHRGGPRLQRADPAEDGGGLGDAAQEPGRRAAAEHRRPGDRPPSSGRPGGALVSVGQTGERAPGLPDHQVGPVPALEKIAGRKVTYAARQRLRRRRRYPQSAFSNLTRTNVETKDAQADPTSTSRSPTRSAAAGFGLHLRTGTLTVPSDGTYTIAFQTRGATGTIDIDGNRVISATGGGRGGGAGAPAGCAPMLPPAVARLRGMHPITGSVVPTADKLNNARAKVELKAGAPTSST